jgi:hypothetical protein
MSAFGGKSGHGLNIAECLLLTQNGHQQACSEVGFSPYQNASLIGYDAMSKA